MKYYLIAGEASGDLHGSNLMKALKAEDPDAQFRFWGGDLMAVQGGELVSHYKDRAYMGFVEVAMNLRKLLGFIRWCREDMVAWQPDVVILVDYPGFNLRMAKYAKEAGFKVCYYISPTIWAWKEGRVNKVKQYVDRMFCILPFEPAFYAKHNYTADYVGHPLLDALQGFTPDNTFLQRHKLGEKPLIAVLPGSRKQELSRILPAILPVIPHFPQYQFAIAKVSALPESLYRQYLGGYDLPLIQDETYQLLAHSTAAVVKSGTSTLETALLNIPEVVVYKTAALNYAIAKRLVKLDYVSLVNLIMGREVVRELLQEECNPEQIRHELEAILPGESRREQILADYAQMRELLGNAGASKKIAKAIVSYLQKG